MRRARSMGGLRDMPEGESRRTGPTALRMLVGAQLRRLREARGITRQRAGHEIHGSHSKISRMELGRSGFKLHDVADLLSLYGVDEAERSAVLSLAEQANSLPWWQEYRDVIPDWFEGYLGLEQDASLIRIYEVQLIPGLLQTEDYARAVIAQGYDTVTAEQIERRVAMRMHRQRILIPPSSRKVWVVLDEGALHRQVGGSAMMRAQLEHLAELAGRPHITIQVLPFTSGAHVGGVGPITIMRFAQAELNDVVYLEQVNGAQYLNRESEVLPYQHLLNKLGIHAQPMASTPAILRRIMSRL